MFERTIERARLQGERRAWARREALAERLAQLPGLSAETIKGGVMLSGRALKRRVALEPALRTMAERQR